MKPYFCPFALALFLLVFFQAAGFCGKIYYYQDESGVKHFTNTPGNNTNFKLFINFDMSSEQLKARTAEIVRRHCKLHDVDYSLVMAVIQVESGFDPWAVSPKGAMGLMQIMPDTLRRMKETKAFDPEENISAGVQYLAMLIKKYKEHGLALAAYNAGPTAVDKYKGIPPYAETENYVAKVLELKKEIEQPQNE